MLEGTSGAVDQTTFREVVWKAALKFATCLHGADRASWL